MPGSPWIRLIRPGGQPMRRIVLAQIVLLALLLWGISPDVAGAQQPVHGRYTTTADVSLRSGPGMNYSVITTLPKGIAVNVIGREGYWLKVESKHGGKPGYIDEQFAQPEGAAQTTPSNNTAGGSVAGAYRTIRDADLREGPGSKYPMVAKLPSGIRVNLWRAKGAWLTAVSTTG